MEKKIKIRNAYSEKDDLVIVYSDGKRRKKMSMPNYLWYCVIKLSDWEKHSKKLLLSGVLDHTELEGNFVKLFSSKLDGKFSDASNLVKLLDQYEIEHFEADLHTAKRYLVDHDVEIDDKYDILYFDIETDDTNRKIEIGATRILSFGAIDNRGKRYYFNDEDELQLLKRIKQLFLKYDVIAGWNIDEFDIPYIEKRIDFKLAEINKSVKRYKGGSVIPWYKIARIDMLRRARKLFKEDASLKSYSLESVSQHFLKKGKVKFEGKVVDLDPEVLKEYNMHDVELVKELDEHTGMIDLIAKECVMAKCLIRDFAGVYVSVPLDMMLLREAHKESIWCPSKRVVEDEVDYVGGLVFEPEKGFHKNVYVFDFTSLYPSIIMTSNIGFDTLVKERKNEDCITNPGTGSLFLKNKESIVAKVVRKLVEERQVYKKLRLQLVGEGKMESEEYTQARANEIIVKELSNSVYGIMGNQVLRYYDINVAESITKTGHYLLEFTRDYFNGIEGLKVIYGDTDSVFVAAKDTNYDVEALLKQYHAELEANLEKQFNISKSRINLKYEKLFSGLIMVGKKYYTGRVINIEGKKVDEFIAKGIDYVKKATFPMVKTAQKELVEMILREESELKIRAFVDKEVFRIKNERFKFDDIKISVGINKELGDYKMKNAPHVKLARAQFEEKGELEIREIEYVVIDDHAPKDQLSGLATREQFKGEFDRTYYWNQKIWPALLRILEAAFPKVDWDEIYYIPILTKRQRVSKNQLPLF